MMRDVKSYIEDLKNYDYFELIEEREELMQLIKDIEKKEIAGDRSGDEWRMCPNPIVHYITYLDYLGELCFLMNKKYKEDYLVKKRTLFADANQPKWVKKIRKWLKKF